jgi:transposase
MAVGLSRGWGPTYIASVLPCVRPGPAPTTSASGQGVNAWPCWQTWVEVVIGVDTHKHTHTAAVVVAATGAMIQQATVPATLAGYRQLLRLANRQDGRRVWAIEGTGGDGAGLTRFLHAHQERVVELDRPRRTARRHGAKSDPLDATRAAREALGRDQLAQPRAAGHRAALSVRLTARRSAVQAATELNASCMPWSLRHPKLSPDGCAA